MPQIWLLTLSGLRKSKAQAASLFCLIALTAIVLNIGLITMRNYASFFDQRAKELNASDVIMLLQDRDPLYTKTYEESIRADKRTKEVEARNVLLANGSCMYADSSTNRMFAILNKQDEVAINRYEFIEKSEHTPAHPIYLPFLFKIGGGYELHDDFVFELANGSGGYDTFSYEVAGFFDEIMLGTINSTTTGFMLENTDYQALSQAFSGTLDAKLYSVFLHDASLQEKYASDHIVDATTAAFLSDSNFYETIRMARTNTSAIGSMLLIAFAIILSLICAVIICFRIINTMEEDVQNIGALKAIGYTGKQIRKSLLLQFLSIALVAAGIGILISYTALPFVSMLFSKQTGVKWIQGFDLISSFLTLASISLVVIMVAITSSYRVIKLHPIVALRMGIKTHSFRRNYIPFDSSKGSLLVMLVKKIFLQEGKQNLMIGMIIAGIAFAAVFAGALYENITLKFDQFLIMTIGEVNDLSVDAKSGEDAKHLMESLSQDEDIRKIISFTMDSIKSEQGEFVYLYTTEDLQMLDCQNMIYEGRFPKYDNEVAIGGILSKSSGKSIGDHITLIKGEHTYTYLITGLIQGSNFMGHDAAMNHEGYRHLRPDFANSSFNIYLQDIKNGDAKLQSISDEYDSSILRIRNVRKSMEASLIIYKEMVQMLVCMIAVIMLNVIILTLYLVLKTSILRKRRELGIQKALGFTTQQLILQNALCFLPTIFISTIIGSGIAYATTNSILSMLFSSFGIMKVNFHISILMILILMLAITIFGFLVCVLVSMRIRKISPYTLMSE